MGLYNTRTVNHHNVLNSRRCKTTPPYFTSITIPIRSHKIESSKQQIIDDLDKWIYLSLNGRYSIAKKIMVGFDTNTGEVAGCTGIEASIGWDVPFYSYHISTIVHSSAKLGVNNVVKLLTFGNNYTGCSEICTLFLRPEFRQGLNGRLMSKCRFLMMAEHPHRFSKTVFAEMRGVSDDEGNSPFWQWLQEHFFSIDFTMADYLTGIGKKGFIAYNMAQHMEHPGRFIV